MLWISTWLSSISICGGWLDVSSWLVTGWPNIWLICFWMCLWGCFWMRITFELLDCVKHFPSLMWVDVIQSGEGLSRMKRQRKGEFTVCLTEWVRTWSPSAFRLEVTPSVFQFTGFQSQIGTCIFGSSGSQASDFNWNYMFTSPGSPAHTQQIMGVLNLHTDVWQFIYIPISNYRYI